GGNLGILSLNDTGSKSKDLSVLHAHSEFITDFDFCPYDDEILATGSQDHHIKLWRITENTLNSNVPSNPEVDILASNKVEVIKFHPQADCIVSAVEGSAIHLYDINKSQSVFADSSHEDIVQSISWRHSGDILASTGRDKKLRLWDPRDPSNNQVADSHSNNRDSRVVWLGDTEQLLTTGFGSGREREVLLRDVRKLHEPVASYSGDSSLGVYIPLFDPDTNMLFLIAKADTALSFWEVLDHAPFLQEATKYLGEVQAKGAALVPKRALEVMDGEVNRILLLGQNCIVPISFQVPRKSYRDFHADLFPDTFAPEPSLTASQWLAGEKSKVTKVSLMPSKTGKSLIKTNHHLGSGPKKEILNSSVVEDSVSSELNKISVSNEAEAETETEKTDSKKPSKPQPARKPSPPIKPKPANIESKVTKSSPVLTPKYVDHVKHAFNNKETPVEPPKKSPAVKRSTRTFGMRVSKFRHLNGNIFPKEFHISDLPTLTRTVPGESNGFDANEKRVAVPIGAAGNFLAILELSNSGRSAAAADMPGLLTSATVMDFCWDPFDSSRIAVACDTGDVQIWNIPEGGLQQKIEEPSICFKAHSEKASVVKFHPCASDIIATSSSDLTIRVWDLTSQEEKFCLQGHSDQILNFAWSPDGQFIATVSKDQKVRIFDPRNSSEPIKEGPGPQGTRGARIVWVLNSAYLAVTGFSNSPTDKGMSSMKKLLSETALSGLGIEKFGLYLSKYSHGSSKYSHGIQNNSSELESLIRTTDTGAKLGSRKD
ncbi:Coronin-7, partial [Araneus ventricosus]